MNSLFEDDFSFGLLIAALNAWASLMFALMLRKSYIAGNTQWVSIFIGLIFFSAAVSVYVWKSLFIQEKEVTEIHGERKSEPENVPT